MSPKACFLKNVLNGCQSFLAIICHNLINSINTLFVNQLHRVFLIPCFHTPRFNAGQPATSAGEFEDIEKTKTDCNSSVQCLRENAHLLIPFEIYLYILLAIAKICHYSIIHYAFNINI